MHVLLFYNCVLTVVKYTDICYVTNTSASARPQHQNVGLRLKHMALFNITK